MSGALPCTASNTPISPPRLAAPTTPRPPTSPAHRSETMSPYRFGITSTSNCSGCITSCMHAASTIRSSYLISGYSRATRADAVEEQAVAQLHDVGLVDRRHLLAAVTARVLEREARDARRRLLGDDLQALDDPGNHLVLEAGVQVFGVLAHDHEIDVLEARRDARQVPHRAQVRVQIERLAQADVHAREALADRRRHRPLEGDLVPADGVDELDRQGLSGALEREDAGDVGSHSIETPVAARMRTTASVTSGPMPSPGISVMVCVIRARTRPGARDPDRC